MTDIDWRLKVYSTVTEDTVIPWTDHKIKKGDVLKVVSIVDLPRKRTLTLPVPDLTALYISNAQKSWSEYWALRVANKIDSSLKGEISFETDNIAFDALELIATSIISAYTALEAFCNDAIPEEHEYWHLKSSKIIVEKSDKKSIERHFSTEKKLTEILPKIYGVGSPKGHKPWQDFKQLKDCRDALIHAKSHETSSVQSGKINLWDKLFKIEKPHLLAKSIFDWYLTKHEKKPRWYVKYPK